MSIVNERQQHAVGQGYFHTGRLSDDSSLSLRYVVDCGAMSKYATARDDRIDRYIKAVGRGGMLDLLFISHAHADHLNGIGRLLAKTKGLRVKTIVMPLMSIEDHLIAFARTALEDPVSAEDSFVQAFGADPVSAVGRFDPGQILLVEGSGNGAPFRRGPDGELNLRRADRGGDDSFGGLDLVGQGVLRALGSTAPAVGSPRVLVAPDSLGMIARTHGSSTTWLLAPYLDPGVKADRAKFMTALAAARRQTVPALRRWLKSTANRQKLVTDHAGDLRLAYAAISADLNVTSLCLYSGPTGPLLSVDPRWHRALCGRWKLARASNTGRVSWLGTGDAALADKKRRVAFFKHYDQLLEHVTTLTLPHHGSDHNFHVELVERIEPDYCVAPADQFSTWRHPGAHVTQSVASLGRFVSVVTSNRRSEVKEIATIS